MFDFQYMGLLIILLKQKDYDSLLKNLLVNVIILRQINKNIEV